MRDQPRISEAVGMRMKVGYVIKRRFEREYGVTIEFEDVDPGILKIIKQLEDEKKRLKKENRKLQKEKEELEDENRTLKRELEMKNALVESKVNECRDLSRRVNMDSTNSSKPPSTDGFRRPRINLRVRTGRKAGGQKGHAGHSVSVPHPPDEIVEHVPDCCSLCVNRNVCSGLVCRDRRYVVDIEMRTKVTEHRSMGADACPLGKGPCQGTMPSEVPAHIQYGRTLTSFVTLLNTCGAMSDKRISDTVRSMFGISLSAGTVVNMVSRTAGILEPVLGEIRERLAGSDVCHADETGARTNGSICWVQNSSNSEYTYQTADRKRGEGVEGNGVLKDFNGILVHDCWQAYWKYGREHAVCNVHILRELMGVKENMPEHGWPDRFIRLLAAMKRARERAEAEGLEGLSQQMLERFGRRYDWVIALADLECPQTEHTTCRGPREIWKGERSLILRLAKRKRAVMLFAYDFKAPFENNQAERDLRNVKTKTKVSGCFRSLDGLRSYLAVMSYLSTGRKHGIGSYEAITEAFNGNSLVVL